MWEALSERRPNSDKHSCLSGISLMVPRQSKNACLHLKAGKLKSPPFSRYRRSESASHLHFDYRLAVCPVRGRIFIAQGEVKRNAGFNPQKFSALSPKVLGERAREAVKKLVLCRE